MNYQTVQVNGKEVAYRKTPGEGQPLVLIHGIGSSSHTWNQAIKLLKTQGRPILALDLPGHGRSAINTGKQSLENFVQAVAAVLEEENIERAHLVGHSLGGGVALAFTEEHPHRWNTLTLAAAGGLGNSTSPLLRAGLLPGSHVAMRVAFSSASVQATKTLSRALRQVGVAPYQLSEGVLEVFEHLSEHEHQAAFLETLHGVLGYAGQKVSALDKLSQLDGKRVSLIWCEKDPVVPAGHGIRANELLKGSTLVILKGTSHEPHNHEPGTFADLVKATADNYEKAHVH